MSTHDHTISAEHRKVVGIAHYFIDIDGSLWSIRNNRGNPCKPHRLKGRITAHGYRAYQLSTPSGKAMKFARVLVLEAFVGLRPAGAHACHWDGNKLNNHRDNLRWDTPAANAADSKRLGLFPSVVGQKNPTAILTDQKVREIKLKMSQGQTNISLAREYGVMKAVISKIKNGRSWRHI